MARAQLIGPGLENQINQAQDLATPEPQKLSRRGFMGGALGATVAGGFLQHISKQAKADDFHRFHRWQMVDRKQHAVYHGIQMFTRNAQRLGEFMQMEQMLEEMRRDRRMMDQIQREYNNQRSSSSSGRVAIPFTFLAKNHTDFPPYGSGQIPQDFPGYGSTRFQKGETVLFGARFPIKGVAGKNMALKIWDPNGNEVTSATKFIKQDHYIDWWNYGEERLGNVIDKHGTGTFNADFYFDGNFWERRPFQLVDPNFSSSQPQQGSNQRPPKNTKLPGNLFGYICNSSKGSDFEGLERDVFYGGERVTAGIYANVSGMNGKELCFNIATPNNSRIHKHRNAKDYFNHIEPFRVTDLINEYGEGQYTASFAIVDERELGSTNFTLLRRGPRTMIDGKDYLEQRPTPVFDPKASHFSLQ
jgi:hypothetical protein